jgi:hypothetical protein
MSFWQIFFLILALLSVLLLVAAFHLEIDTRRKRYAVRWLFFSLATDSEKGGLRFGLAGWTFGKRSPEKTPSTEAAPSPPSRPSKLQRFFILLAGEPRLALDLLKKMTRYLVRVVRTFTIALLEGEFSFSDPLLNGVCYGIVCGIEIPKTRIGVNFREENWFQGRFYVRLYRLVIPTALLMATLPYGALFGLAWGKMRGNGEEAGQVNTGY